MFTPLTSLESGRISSQMSLAGKKCLGIFRKCFLPVIVVGKDVTVTVLLSVCLLKFSEIRFVVKPLAFAV